MSDHKLIKVQGADGGIELVNASRIASLDAGFRPLAASMLTGMSAKDANAGIAFAISQLAYTEALAYKQFSMPLQYSQLVPISHEAGEWAKTIRIEMEDSIGIGKRTSGRGNDVNLVDVEIGDRSYPVLNGNVGYSYSLEELRESMFLNRPLSASRAASAIEAYEYHMNNVALFGETGQGGDVYGLFDHPSMPKQNAVNGNWETTSEQEIIEDINSAIITVYEGTACSEWPTTIVMAPEALNVLATRVKEGFSDKTLLAWIKENHIAKVQANKDIEFVAGQGLNNKGVGGTRRMIAYVKNPRRLVLHIPMALRFIEPQKKGFAIEVPGEYKYAGLDVRYPSSMVAVDGI